MEQSITEAAIARSLVDAATQRALFPPTSAKGTMRSGVVPIFSEEATAQETMPSAPQMLPPPPDWPHPEIYSILAELDYGPVAQELWQDYRFARLIASPPLSILGSRAEPLSPLFHRVHSERAAERLRAAQNGAPELGSAFHAFASLRRRDVDHAEIMRACAQIADWADGRSLPLTAVEFARAAAAVAPDDPEAANLAALMLRRQGDWKRAEQFYARAIVLAKRQKRNAQPSVRRRARIELICGHIGMAALLYSRGVNLPRAVKHLNSAAHLARRGHLWWLAAHVRHDRMLLLLERADFTNAEDEAKRAIELYPLHDRRFPFFVADVALVQVMQHRYSAAMPLLQHCLEVIEQPAARAVIESMLARCYAALGVLNDYRVVRESASSLALKYPEHSAAAYYHLAEAARACRSWHDAEQHARRALELATLRGDREITRHAEQVLRLSQEHEVASPARTTGPEALTGELRVRLKRWNPHNQRGRGARIHFRNQWVA